jgi:hypothetical protein
MPEGGRPACGAGTKPCRTSRDQGGEAALSRAGQPLGVSGQSTPAGDEGAGELLSTPSENGVVIGSTGSLWHRAQ